MISIDFAVGARHILRNRDGGTTGCTIVMQHYRIEVVVDSMLKRCASKRVLIVPQWSPPPMDTRYSKGATGACVRIGYMMEKEWADEEGRGLMEGGCGVMEGSEPLEVSLTGRNDCKRGRDLDELLSMQVCDRSRPCELNHWLLRHNAYVSDLLSNGMAAPVIPTIPGMRSSRVLSEEHKPSESMGLIT
ncbi:hypothetical protein EVAR_63888_1 [Eumeta japonica]|uniref:Uncharacterized protein n=1 Tax=Eumeta variegata TaxID=151549 RepID=A0A4C1ZDD2_EUMVA|nr:hypothetical protein EVAR_63888_1 [Eumeta japonica]